MVEITLVRIVALSVGLAISSGCAGHPAATRPPEGWAAEPIMLDISNHNWLDVVVYVVHDGQQSRLVTVPAAGSAAVVIPEYALRNQGQIRLLAHAVGNSETFLSEPIIAKRGLKVDWTLETDLKRSSVAVW